MFAMGRGQAFGLDLRQQVVNEHALINPVARLAVRRLSGLRGEARKAAAGYRLELHLPSQTDLDDLRLEG